MSSTPGTVATKYEPSLSFTFNSILESVSSYHTFYTEQFARATSQTHKYMLWCQTIFKVMQGPLAPERIMRWKSWNSAVIVVWVRTAWWLVHSDAPVTRKSVGPSSTLCELNSQNRGNRTIGTDPNQIKTAVWLFTAKCTYLSPHVN